MNTDQTLKSDRTADWYMDVVWPLLPVPGEFDGMGACDQLRWRSVVRLAIEYVLCGERGTPPSSKTPHCPKSDGPGIRGCKGWECRDGWPDDPTLKPDIAALKRRLAEDPGFAAQVTGEQAAMQPELALFFRDLRNHLLHVIDMSKGEHYLDVVRLNAQALIRRMELITAAPAEFECLGEPSLCTNPRGCACVPDSKTPNAELTGGSGLPLTSG